MSSDPLYVEFPDGFKLWGIYYGTSDCILPRLFDTPTMAEDAYFCDGGFDNLNTPAADQQEAERTKEPVRFFTSYGTIDHRYRELRWEGYASRSSRVVLGPFVQPPGEYEY